MALTYLGETVGQDSESSTCVASSVPGGTNIMYICVIHEYTNSGSPGSSDVSTVVGLSLSWARVAGTVACTGRISQPRGEIWWAYGSPSSGDVTVTLNGACNVNGVQIAVCRISGAANTAPINGCYANSNGAEDPACGGGTDGDPAVQNIEVDYIDSMVVQSFCPRNEDAVDTPDTDYTEELISIWKDGGNSSSIWLYQRTGASGTEVITHTIGADKAWQTSACEVTGPQAAHDQDGFRFYDDDDVEADSTPLDDEDTNITLATNTNARERVQCDVTGDAESETAELQYKEDSDAATEWRKVPLP